MVFAKRLSLYIGSMVSLLLCCSFAQVSTPPPKPAGTTAAAQDPTKPEKQPDLALDRDPVVSPDPEDNAPVSAQSAASTEIKKGQSNVYTLQENVNEVLLNCTVLDEKGRLVTDLTKGDFKLWEDGVAQTIDSFQHQDLPVSIGILVDNSGSMLDKHAAVKTAALDLLKGSNPQDAAFIVNFSDKAYLDQNLTSDRTALERGLSRFDSRSTTALYDAVVASANELSVNAKQPKQVVLIITDGADNASRETLEQAIRRVQNLGGPVVYSIGLLFGEEKQEAQSARKALETLSAETGGVAYFPASLDDVDAIAQQVAQDIRNQYTIGYHSTKSPTLGGYRTVQVEAQAAHHGKLIVRTRKGYYPNAAENTQAVK